MTDLMRHRMEEEMKVVVLAGGTSTERDVSLSTGSMVCKALKERGHKALLLDVFLGYKGEVTEDIFENRLELEMAAVGKSSPDLAEIKAMRQDGGRCFFGPNVIDICQRADIVFMALHGENGENGKIQAAFDLLGIRYTGSGYLGSALAMDKGLSKQMFRLHGVPTPEGYILQKGDEDSVIPKFPCVVKVCNGGSSVGVYMAHNNQEYKSALADAWNYEDKVVVEQYIKGREFSVGVVGGKAYPIIEIAPIEGFYDYKNKYQAGSTVETCPAVLDDKIAAAMQETAVRVAEVLNLGSYSRSDFIMEDNGRFYCLEANTLPGMTPTSLLPQEAAVLGISYGELCETLIDISMKKYENE